jgi:hypothetical protein
VLKPGVPGFFRSPERSFVAPPIAAISQTVTSFCSRRLRFAAGASILQVNEFERGACQETDVALCTTDIGLDVVGRQN